jgi:hypothetical protein
MATKIDAYRPGIDGEKPNEEENRMRDDLALALERC